MASVRIERRFRGPPESGNGGYTAGLAAEPLGGEGCQVTLLRPPPLERSLTLEPGLLRDGEEAIATAVAAAFELEVPDPPSQEDAEAAQRLFTGFDGHIFPGCFVCGPERAPGDGLRIFAGPLQHGEGVAAVWRPDAGIDAGDGRAAARFVWAALDCPGYFAVERASGPALLGRIAARIWERPAIGEPAIIHAWPIGGEGRKHFAGSALHKRDGRLLAAARATWISLRK